MTAVSSSSSDIWKGTLDFNGSEDLHVAVPLLQARAERCTLNQKQKRWERKWQRKKGSSRT